MEDKLNQVFNQGLRLTYKKSETIVRAGERPDYIYHLEKGFIRQYTVSLAGDELTMNIFRPGSIFYLAWMWGIDTDDYFFEAMDKVTVVRVPMKEMEEYLKVHPELVLQISNRLVRGMQAMLKRIEVLVFGNARQKVAATILNFAQRFGNTQGSITTIQLPVTHRLIASVAAVARETASIEIERLYKEKIISQQGRTLAVLDLGKLKGETGEG